MGCCMTNDEAEGNTFNIHFTNNQQIIYNNPSYINTAYNNKSKEFNNNSNSKTPNDINNTYASEYDRNIYNYEYLNTDILINNSKQKEPENSTEKLELKVVPKNNYIDNRHNYILNLENSNTVFRKKAPISLKQAVIEQGPGPFSSRIDRRSNNISRRNLLIQKKSLSRSNNFFDTNDPYSPKDKKCIQKTQQPRIITVFPEISESKFFNTQNNNFDDNKNNKNNNYRETYPYLKSSYKNTIENKDDDSNLSKFEKNFKGKISSDTLISFSKITNIIESGNSKKISNKRLDYPLQSKLYGFNKELFIEKKNKSTINLDSSNYNDKEKSDMNISNLKTVFEGRINNIKRKTLLSPVNFEIRALVQNSAFGMKNAKNNILKMNSQIKEINKTIDYDNKEETNEILKTEGSFSKKIKSINFNYLKTEEENNLSKNISKYKYLFGDNTNKYKDLIDNNNSKYLNTNPTNIQKCDELNGDVSSRKHSAIINEENRPYLKNQENSKFSISRTKTQEKNKI